MDKGIGRRLAGEETDCLHRVAFDMAGVEKTEHGRRRQSRMFMKIEKDILIERIVNSNHVR
jgi:hypothetical protein